MDNLAAFLAAAGALTNVVAHGFIGHRWSTMQLRDVALQPTRIIGDGDLARRLFMVSWHIVTATFVGSAIALFLAAVGAVDSPALLRCISILHVAYLSIGATIFAPRTLDAFTRPIPALAGICMLDVAVFAWVASV